jgi:hypothetical protein
MIFIRLYTKGVAHLLDELYDHPGDRIMVDIDLLGGKRIDGANSQNPN